MHRCAGVTQAISFIKMHGLGNDFVVLDAREGALPAMTATVARALADRRTGIGFDQLILLEPSQTHDFRVRFFNSDGSEAGLSGNGLRCAAAFALVAQGQATGDAAAKAWPDLSMRGREFFVRAMARLMDETGRDRTGIAALVNAEAQALTTSGELQKVMPSCLLMLEAAQL